MQEDLFKLLSPIPILLFWLFYISNRKNLSVAAPALFFTSIVCFSQNFVFFYREFHQIIQVALIAFYIPQIIRVGRLSRFNLILFPFLALILISQFFNPFDSDSKSQLVNYIIVILVVNALYFRGELLKIEKTLKFIGNLGVVVAMLGCFEYILTGSPRVEVTFSNPNYFAFFLGIAWVINFEFLKGRARVLILFVMTITIILSGSRSALAFPLFCVLWFIYRQGVSKRGVLVLLVAGCVVSFLYVFDLTRFSDKEAVSGSDGERKLFAQIGLNMVNDNPYFGVGWGRYISEFSNYSSTVDKLHIGNHILDASKQDRRVSHNDFLRIMAELGWLSLLLCIIYCGYCIHILMFQTMALSGVVFPIWCGMILFSLTHNNLNTAFSWYFLLLPIFIKNLNLRSKYHGY